MAVGRSTRVLSAPWAAVAAFGLLAATCTGPSTGPTTASTGFPATTIAGTTLPPATTGPATSATTTTSPAVKDLTVRPQIWFGPLDPSFPSLDRPYSGSNFFDLFEAGAAWDAAADGIHVFRLYGGWVARVATPAQLEQVIQGLEQREIAISYEGGPLVPSEECTGVIEGFAGPVEAQQIVSNIAAAGGVVRFVGLEHGFDATTFGPAECRESPVATATDLAITMGVVRESFPAAVGDLIETGDLDVGLIAEWLEAYREVLGEYPNSLQLDVDYGRPDWPFRAREIEEHVEGLGIDFGIFYLGDRGAGSDRLWLEQAWERVVEYEVVNGGSPGQVLFQSWHPHPEQLVPEDDPSSYTFLVDRYLAPRTALDVSVDGTEVQGRLVADGGEPVGGAEVEVRLTPMTGPGVMHTYTIEGIVPDDAVRADVGWRFNTECGCSGPVEVRVAGFEYSDDGGGGPVPAGAFDDGLDRWSVFGAAEAVLTEGPAVDVVTGPGVSAAANSAPFGVTPGSSFTMSVQARVSPASEGSGYFSLIFQSEDGEVRRHQIHLRRGWRVAATATTGGDGGFAAVLDEEPPQRLGVEAWFYGDDGLWPALGVAG